MTAHGFLLEHEALLIGVLERPDRLTPAVLGMADRLPPDQRRLLRADWRRHLQAHRALVRELLAEARSAAGES
jgi:hypothetical protein